MVKFGKYLSVTPELRLFAILIIISIRDFLMGRLQLANP